MVLSREPQFASVTNVLGRRIYYDPDDVRGSSLQNASGNLNSHSLELWELALGLHDWECVVDVGSNYGEMIVGASVPTEARIVAFEPNQRVLPYLKRTLSEYGRPVELIDRAVSDQVAHDVPFERDVTWSGKSSLVLDRDDTANEEIVRVTVEVTTLDDVLSGRDLGSACIKVGVEGNEAAVLRGATQALAGLDKWAIMLEILHMNMTQLGQLVSAYHLYLLDFRKNSLVRVLSRNPDTLNGMLHSGWLYPQDALLLSAPLTNWIPR